MEINLTIYTYGHLDAMFYVLNGIAMIMSSKFADMLIKTISMIATLYYAYKAAYAGASGGSKQHLVKIAAIVIVINSLLMPKTDMLIVDLVNKQKEKVDNLPLGFAVPVGLMEEFGNILTGGFEQAFGVVGSSNYRDYGMVFGARLLQEARNWKIKTPEFSNNMYNFIRNCAVIEAALGRKYNINDLLQSSDVWSLVKKNASQLLSVPIKSGREYELKTCKEAAVILDSSFGSELTNLSNKYLNMEFGRAGNITEVFTAKGVLSSKNYFKNNINTVFGHYLGATEGGSAESKLKQFMMMNSMSDYSRSYGFARASMTQETNWRIAGDLASTYLPLLLSVIKGLVYASFIFMVPLMLLGGGGAKYLNYIAVIASLQLWPALNAILNMFIDLYSSNLMSGLADGAISFTSYSTIGDYSDKIVAVASGLQMVIPYLAFSIVQGGVSGFIQLTGNITSASNTASSSTAQEVVSGNKSFDNYSAGNVQMAMNQGFKTDYNSSFRHGASETQLNDGTIQKTLPNGNTLLQSGVGVTQSGGATRISLRDAHTSAQSETLSNAHNQLESRTATFHESERAAFNRSASYLAHLAKRESQGETFDYSKSGEKGFALQNAVNAAKSLNANYNYGWEQSAQLALNGNAGLSSGGKGGLFGSVGGGIGIGGSINSTNLSSQSVGDNNHISRDQNTSENYNNIVRALSSEQFAKSNNIDKSFSDDVRSSYEKQLSAEQSMNVQADKVSNLSKSLSQTLSSDASHDMDIYDAVQKEVAHKHGVSLHTAHRMIESHDPRVKPVISSVAAQYSSTNIVSEIQAAQVKFSSANNMARLEEAALRYGNKIQSADNYADVLQRSKEQGIDPSNSSFVQNNIAAKVDDLIIDNQGVYNLAQKQNRDEANGIQSQVDKYEQDRVGQGMIGKTLGIGGSTNPSAVQSNSGDNQIIKDKK